MLFVDALPLRDRADVDLVMRALEALIADEPLAEPATDAEVERARDMQAYLTRDGLSHG